MDAPHNPSEPLTRSRGSGATQGHYRRHIPSSPCPQEELVELKQRVPGLRLKKSTPAQSLAAPFPITAAAEVEAPPASDRYDVASYGLLARLGAGVAAATASAVPQAGNASHPQQQAGAATVADAVQVEVVSAELPRVLRQAMAAELHRTWAASSPGKSRMA